MFYAEADIVSMIADLGVDVTINGVARKALLDESYEHVVPGAATAAVGTYVLVTAPAAHQGQIGQAIVIGTASFTIRDVVRFQDGGVIGAVCERAS